MKGKKQCGMCESLQVLKETKFCTAVVILGYHTILISNTSGFCEDLYKLPLQSLFNFIPALQNIKNNTEDKIFN